MDRLLPNIKTNARSLYRMIAVNVRVSITILHYSSDRYGTRSVGEFYFSIHEIFVYRVSCILIHETTYTTIYWIIHDNTR